MHWLEACAFASLIGAQFAAAIFVVANQHTLYGQDPPAKSENPAKPALGRGPVQPSIPALGRQWPLETA
jgi:hypothetical protein